MMGWNLVIECGIERELEIKHRFETSFIPAISLLDSKENESIFLPVLWGACIMPK